MIEIKKDFTDRELLWFGPLLGLFVGIIGAILSRRFGLVGAAYGLWMVAGIAIAVYYAIPAIRKPMYRAWLYSVFPIGWVMSHLLLGIVYYLILTPIGLAMNALGYDPMHRRIDPTAETYWIDREPAVDYQQYFRQS